MIKFFSLVYADFLCSLKGSCAALSYSNPPEGSFVSSFAWYGTFKKDMTTQTLFSLVELLRLPSL